MNAENPTEYRITRKGEHWPFALKGRNPRTGRWDTMFETEDAAFLREWIDAERATGRTFSVTDASGANPRIIGAH